MASTGFSQANVRGNALRAGGLVEIPRQHCRLHCPARLRSECTTGSRGALEDCTRSCRRGFMPKAKCKPSINPPFDQPVKSALVFSAFSIPRINALRSYVIENKSRPIFPSWTSRVRVPSPAPNFSISCKHPPNKLAPIGSIHITLRADSSLFTASRRRSSEVRV